MDWMSAAFWAWFGWNVLAPLALVSLLLLAFAPSWIERAWKQSRCTHERYHETSACDAICSDCGKNLGFIGDVRQAQRDEQGGGE